jgi:hypothetical protein
LTAFLRLLIHQPVLTKTKTIEGIIMRKKSNKNNDISYAEEPCERGVSRRFDTFKWGRIMLRAAIWINRLSEWLRAKGQDQIGAPTDAPEDFSAWAIFDFLQ